jgi:hypothetical protein
MSEFLFLGHATIKFITTMLIAGAAGLVTNIFGNYSGWKQRILALVLCLVALFLNFPRLFQVLRLDIGTLKLDYIWHIFRTDTAVMPSIQNTTQNSADQQSDSNRF